MGIQVPPDDAGKIVETNTPVADHRQVVTMGDAVASTLQTVGANGAEVDVQASVLPTGAATSAAQLADGHNVTVDNASGASAVNIQDGGNVISVDAASLPLPTGAATLAAQLADGHNVTVDNASGAAAVNIQDGGNSLTIDLNDTIDSNNSTTTPLGISATFTGIGTNVIGYTSVTVQFAADQDSATAGLRIEFSEDDTNWDFSHAFEFLANVSREFHFGVHGQFFRIVFVNGTTAQTFFRTQTILHRGSQAQEIHRLDENLAPDHPAYAVRAAIVAQAAGAGNFVPVQATAAGNLKFSLEEVDAGVVISVDDNGGSLTIDAVSLPLPTGAATSALQLADGHNVTVDNAAAAPVPTGITTIGDVLVKPGDSVNDAMRVNIVAGGGAGGTSMTDDAAFTPGSTGITPAGGTFRTVRDLLDDNDGGAIALTQRRGVYTSVETPAGDSAMDDTADAVKSLGVSDDGTSVMDDANSAMRVNIVAGSAGATEYTEDAVSAADPIGGQLIARRRDTPAVETTTDGDVTALNCTGEGSLNVELRSGTGETGTSGTPLRVDPTGGTTQPISAASLPLPAGASTSAGQLADGHNVTVDNGAGAAAVNIQDGGNTISIDAASLPLPAGASTSALQLAADHLVDLNSEHTRNAAFVESIPAGGELDDTAPVAATEGNVSPVRITAQRAFHSNLRNNAGTEIGTAGVPVRTDTTGATTQPISAASLPLPAGAATSALQLVDGHNVTVDNAAGASAVNIQDGGNSLTVDGTITSDVGAGTRPISAVSLPLPAGAATSALQLADGHNVTVDNAAGASAVNIQDGGNTISIDAASLPLPTGASTSAAQLADGHGVAAAGDVAHDGVDSGNPVKLGLKAIAHGAVTAVAADDRTDWYANRDGIPFVIAGHPNILTLRLNATGAQANVAIVTQGAGGKIVVTRLSAMLDNATTVDVQVRIGFGATTTPTTTGVLLSHPGIAAGSGVVEGTGSGILGIGADGEDLRVTSEVPTTGSLDIVVSYYIIDS